jgi:hypothetical protein
MLRRSSTNSLTSVNSMTSMSSINSRTKIYNSRDFYAYMANIEEDITNVYNNNYNLSIKYDKKIDNIINRYENRTNKLFIDLRKRESQYIKLNSKLDCIIEEMNGHNDNFDICNKPSTYIYISMSDIKDIDNICKYILHSLYAFTAFVIALIITSFIQ